MKNLRFAHTFHFALSRYLVICVGLICASHVLGQGQADTPTGLAGGFGGSITTGGGSFDPYERNATRSVTDIVVPGAVVPFTYTRIWNSRTGWSDNWSWGIDEIIAAESGGSNSSDLFKGYTVHYPDGRVVKFNKPTDPKHLPRGAPGTYSPGTLLQDRLVLLGNTTQAELRLTDGSVVNFTGTWDAVNSCVTGFQATSIVDPHGLAITFTYDSTGTVVTEPGGRWIHIAVDPIVENPSTSVVTTSLGQTVTYTNSYYTEGSFLYDGHGDPDDDRIKTNRDTVTYNDVVDPNTGLPLEAHYLYKWVQHPSSTPNIQGTDGYRLTWASDPMFDGPLQQIKYTYVDNMSAPTGDFYMSAVLEERWAPNYWDPNAPRYHDAGVLVSRVEMMPWTYSQTTGNSEGYYTRKETRGDGAVRTISYFNATTGHGQIMVDHFTDFKNDPTKIERHEYDWASGTQPQFQTPTKITDANGHVTLQTLEPVLGHVTDQEHPDHSHSSWTYTDPNHPYYVGSKTDELVHPTYYTRDPNTHRVTQIDYPDGGYETFLYNGFGQVREHRMTSGGTETFTYDERGLKTEYRDPYHATGNPTFRYQYDGKDRLSGVTDARGAYSGDPAYTTNYEYDGRNQITLTTHPTDPATGQRYTIQNVYNMATGTLASTTDELGHTTSYTYDEYNRVLAVTNPLGKTTTSNYALDWEHPLAHTTNNPKYVTTPSGKNTIFDYDPNFRKRDQVVALGTADEAWTLFEYDDVGNLTKTTDPRFYETRFGYDNRNRKIWMDDPIASDRNSSGHTMNWEYDDAGNKTKETRADNAFRGWEYDIPNRITRSIDWRMSISESPLTTTKTRDLPDATTHLTIEHVVDAKNAEYKFESDALGRKISETYPVDATQVVRTKTFKYDAAGNLILYKNPANQYKHLDYIDSYDSRNRLRHAAWNLSATDSTTVDRSVGQEIRSDYDAASRMTQIITNNGETTVAFGYDDANRQILEEQTLAAYPTRRVETPRNDDGNRDYLYVPGYYLLYYDYTQRNQLFHIKDGNQNPAWTYTYDKAGNVTNRFGQWGLPNGVNYGYDPLNRVELVEQGNATEVFARNHYQYDKVSREVATWRDGPQDTAGSKGERFWYTTNNQVQEAWYKADNVSTAPSNPATYRHYTYTPDMLNWSSVNDNGYPAPFAANALNQYTSVNGSSPHYDDRFNLDQFGGVAYPHDAANQLTSATGNGHSMSFTYDGLGRCVRRVVDEVTSLFTYDAWNPIMEWDEFGNWKAMNLYGFGADEILGRFDAVWGALIYKQDKQGNVTFVLDSSNQTVEKYSYDAYGTPTILSATDTQLSTSAIGNRFMYTGREWIGELGIYDYRHRYYLPSIGRFLETDPMGLQTEGEKLSAGQKALYSPGSSAPETFSSSDMNLFRYCGDDPVDRNDPMGLLTIIIAGYGPQSYDPQKDADSRNSNKVFMREALKRYPDGKVFGRSNMRGAMEAVRNARSHGDRKLNIVGYSLGAAAGVQLAHDLGVVGVGVDKLVTIDIVRAPGFAGASLPNPVPIPGNVKEAYNYYQQSGGFHPTNFTGTPVIGNNVLVNKEITPENVGGPVHHAWMPGFVFPQR